MSVKTPCDYCGKSYVKVLEHITKSHSWLQLVFNKDNEIGDEDHDMKIELFWKGHSFHCVQIEDRGYWKDKPLLMFESDTFPGLTSVSLKHSIHNPQLFVVNGIGTCFDRAGKEVREDYDGGYVQVLHKDLKL